MTQVDITFVVSDNAVTLRERRRQSAFREEVLGLAPGRAGEATTSSGTTCRPTTGGRSTASSVSGRPIGAST